MRETKITNASVKVMRSHDYCHFEVVIGLEGDTITDKDINNARIQAAHLTDTAVEQYKQMKSFETTRANSNYERSNLEREVAQIRLKPEQDRSVLEKAKVKALEDYKWEDRFNYDDDRY